MYSEVSYLRMKVGFPIRKSADRSFFAAPRGLSQRTTSFIASQRQGIHRTPFWHLITLMIDVRRLAAADRSERPLFACRTRPINAAVTPSLVAGLWGPDSRTGSLVHDVKMLLRARSAV